PKQETEPEKVEKVNNIKPKPSFLEETNKTEELYKCVRCNVEGDDKQAFKHEQRKEKQQNYKCVLGGEDLGFSEGELKLFRKETTGNPIPRAMLICLKCLFGDDIPPTEKDLKAI
ncbi:9922_t:CDS:2, partial [Ambispora gerdemannii]